jgi:hypothetical protein
MATAQPPWITRVTALRGRGLGRDSARSRTRVIGTAQEGAEASAFGASRMARTAWSADYRTARIGHRAGAGGASRPGEEQAQQRARSTHGSGALRGDLMVPVGGEAQHHAVLVDSDDEVQVRVPPATIAAERASFGSVLSILAVSNSVTRADSFGGTSTTRSPVATSCWETVAPISSYEPHRDKIRPASRFARKSPHGDRAFRDTPGRTPTLRKHRTASTPILHQGTMRFELQRFTDVATKPTGPALRRRCCRSNPCRVRPHRLDEVASWNAAIQHGSAQQGERAVPRGCGVEPFGVAGNDGFEEVHRCDLLVDE